MIRQLFIKARVIQRLVVETYRALLKEAEQLKENLIQETFRFSTNCQALVEPSQLEDLQCRSLDNTAVSSF